MTPGPAWRINSRAAADARARASPRPRARSFSIFFNQVLEIQLTNTNKQWYTFLGPHRTYSPPLSLRYRGPAPLWARSRKGENTSGRTHK